MPQFGKAAILIVVLAVLNGCGTTPLPVPVFLEDLRTQNINSVAQSPPNYLEIVMKCIALNLEENAGLKIAGVIVGGGESPYVFATPEKSDGLLVICIKELNVADPTTEIQLTLVLRAFNDSGENIYTRSITGVSETVLPQNGHSDIEKALQTATKGILRQYAQDPILRPLIVKYKLGSLLKFG